MRGLLSWLWVSIRYGIKEAFYKKNGGDKVKKG
jgi:hypothetical protein